MISLWQGRFECEILEAVLTGFKSTYVPPGRVPSNTEVSCHIVAFIGMVFIFHVEEKIDLSDVWPLQGTGGATPKVRQCQDVCVRDSPFLTMLRFCQNRSPSQPASQPQQPQLHPPTYSTPPTHPPTCPLLTQVCFHVFRGWRGGILSGDETSTSSGCSRREERKRTGV